MLTMTSESQGPGEEPSAADESRKAAAGGSAVSRQTEGASAKGAALILWDEIEEKPAGPVRFSNGSTPTLFGIRGR